MASGLKVTPSKVQNGSQDMQYLQGQGSAVADYALNALATMAGSVGHPALESALNEAASRGRTSFMGMLAAYGHAGDSLIGAGQIYSGAEDWISQNAAGILRGFSGLTA